MSSVTESSTDSLTKHLNENTSSEEKTNTTTYRPEKTSKDARVKKAKDQALPSRNLRDSRSTQTSPATEKDTATSSKSSMSTSKADSNGKTTTRSTSSTTAGRANRDTQSLVAASKDARAVTEKEPSRTKKRAAEDKQGGRAKRQVRSSQELGLTYNSIRAINMPPRPGQIPGQAPPPPVFGSFPFGDTEDHQNSMIIYWLDDLEYTYAKTTELYNKTFPKDQVTDEAVRRRHIRSLERLQKRYGTKPVAQIGIVGKNIARRGRPRAPRLSGIEPESDPSNAATPSEEQIESDLSATEDNSAPKSHSPPKARLAKALKQAHREKRNHQGHEFDKACIVVWRDADNMLFKDIRARLDNERGWSLGEPTVKKEYTKARARIWGTAGPETAADKEDNGDGSVAEGGEEEDEEDVEMKEDSVGQVEI